MTNQRKGRIELSLIKFEKNLPPPHYFYCYLTNDVRLATFWMNEYKINTLNFKVRFVDHPVDTEFIQYGSWENSFIMYK